MKICKVEGCERIVHGKEFCAKHLKHIRKYGKIVHSRFDRNKIVMIDENFAKIILQDAKGNITGEAIIDNCNIELVKDHKWHNSKGYPKANHRVDGKAKGLWLHRLIMDGFEFVDHIDRDPMNNRMSNLRGCTRQENNRNKSPKKGSSSGVVGVMWNKGKRKWDSRVALGEGKVIRSRHENIEDAIKSRLYQEVIHFGEFAPQKHLIPKYFSGNICTPDSLKQRRL